METQACVYCGRVVNVLRMTDGVCSTNVECVLRLHRSYSHESFVEQCKHYNEDPEIWEQYFAEMDDENAYWDDLKKIKLGQASAERQKKYLLAMKEAEDYTIKIENPEMPEAIARNDLVDAGLIEVVVEHYKYKLTAKGLDYVGYFVRK